MKSIKSAILIFLISLSTNLFAWTSSNEGVCYSLDTLCTLSDDISFNNFTQMYEINTSIIILDNDSLIVQPSEIINFLGHFYIRIYGNLKAIGTETEKIKFGNPDFTFGNGNFWFGIQFFDTSPDGECILKHCEIKGAVLMDENYACMEAAILCENASPLINHCEISKMTSDCDTGGGIGILCLGESKPLISYCAFKELYNSVALLCWPEIINDTTYHPDPLVFGNNFLQSVTGFWDFFCDYDVIIYNGGFIDNCFIGAAPNSSDTTLGFPIDTIGDGICTTTSTFWETRFKNVDGVKNPRGDTLITGIQEEEINILPTTSQYLLLNKNYPNPFSNFTTIEFEVKKPEAEVSLFIFDSRGNLICKLFDNKWYALGEHSIKWFAENENREPVKDGIYFYKLISDGEMKVKKAIVVK